MQVICLEDTAFYKLIDEVVARLKDQHKVTEDRWLGSEAAMEKLHIKSKTTLQKLRDEGHIRFSQPEKRIILYDANSINEYIEKHARKTF